MLQEVLDELNDALELDLAHMTDLACEEDIEIKYPEFIEKTHQKADQFKQNSHGYRQICCLPSFALSLTMASKVQSHYTHAPWFKLSALSEMIGVHGAVSKQIEHISCQLIGIGTVHCRVHH